MRSEGRTALITEAASGTDRAMAAAEATATRLKAVEERRQPRVLVGLDAKIAAAAERIAPVNHGRLLDRGVR